MKTKEKLLLSFGIFIFLVLCGISYYFIFEKDYTYYTQVDNSKIKENTSKGGVIDKNGGMEYIYTLIMYDENGKSKKIHFGTNRELRENAFLKIKYYLISGVNKWEEIEYEELPDKVKEKYDR